MALGQRISDILWPEDKPIGFLPHAQPPPGEWTGWMFRGGRGCVAPWTRIYDAETGEHRPIADIATPLAVATLDGFASTDGAPFLKGLAHLYEVKTEDGCRIMVTRHHRFLTPNGWDDLGWEALDDLRLGDQIAGGAPTPDNPEGSKTWTRIVSVTYSHHGEFWDLTVPGAKHYAAEGLWNHNSSKSHTLTSYMREEVLRNPNVRGRIIGPTLGDLIEADVYGPAGILVKDDRVQFRSSAPGGSKLVWPTGAEFLLIGIPTRRDVDRLRASGNREVDLWEEGAAIPYLEEAWTQAELGRRLGRPRWMMATTPRARKILKTLEAEPGVVVTRGLAKDNPYNPPEWVAAIDAKYKGTRLYRQEVLGEILDDVEGALWKQADIDLTRRTPSEVPELLKKAVGVDPASGGGTTGIVVVALGVDGHLYVLDDLSEEGRTADEWAKVAADAAHEHNCPLIAENDMGGDMVRSVLKAARHDVVVKPARARNMGSKEARATPVALLWEKDDPEAHIVGELPRLEEQLTTWTSDSSDSPDRLDALVHAARYLHAGAAWEDAEVDLPKIPDRQPSRMGLIRFGG